MANGIIDAASRADIAKLVGYILIFGFIWIEVRGLKQELHILNKTIGDSFKKGEDRFSHIESDIKNIKTEITSLKQKTLP